MLTLFIVAVVDVLGFGILVPLIPYMADHFGVAPALITPILGAYSLCQFVAAPVWGRLSDRYGRRPILMSSFVGACASYIILGLAHNLWWLLASRMLAGFMAGNLSAAFAYAADISKPEDRAKSLGMVGAAIGIGFMLGPFIGGLLAGENRHAADFTLPAIVSACTSLLALALVRFVLPESRRLERAAAPGLGPELSGRDGRSRLLSLLAARPALRLLVTASFLVTSAVALLESIVAIWAMNRWGFGPLKVGIMLFGLAFIAVVMQGGVVRMLVPRLGEVRLAVMGVCAFVAGLLLVGWQGGLPLAIAGFALCGVGMGAYSPCLAALASKQASADDRGAVMGSYQASASLGRALIPFAAGAIYSVLGANAPFLVAAGLALPAVVLIKLSATRSQFRISTPPDR